MNDINEFESARENNLIDYLRSAISDGVAGMLDAPSLLRQIIENELWRERFVRADKRNRPVRHLRPVHRRRAA